MTRWLALPLLAFGLLAASHAAPPVPLPLQPFTAHYAVYLDGKQRGESSIRLESLGNGQWRYSVSAEGTSGMARLAGFESTAHSDFQRDAEGNIRLLRIESASHALFKSRKVKAQLDWDAKLAHWSGDLDTDRRAPTPLTPRATSSALLNLMLAQAAQQAKTGQTFGYQLLDRGHGKAVRYTAQAVESVSVPAGRFNARAMQFPRRDKPRVTTAWFADFLPWAPIRLLQTDDGQAKYELRLLRVD